MMKEVWAPCSSCIRETTHKVLHEHALLDEERTTTYSMLECAGVIEFALRNKFSTSMATSSTITIHRPCQGKNQTAAPRANENQNHDAALGLLLHVNLSGRARRAVPPRRDEKLWPEDQTTDNPDFKAQFARIVEGLRKAGLPDEPATAAGRLARASALSDVRRWDSALKEVEAVIAEDPNNATALGAAGQYKMFLGPTTSKRRFA
jgi:hypothetical protein